MSNTVNKPAINPDVDSIVDRIKYGYAVCTKGLAEMQHRIAELAGTGKLDPDESMDLQHQLLEIWQNLYSGTTCAVRDWDTDDRTWDWADNHYSDGSEVMTPGPGDNRTDAQRAAEAAWEFNPFLLGDGAVEDMPLGNESVIAKPPAA